VKKWHSGDDPPLHFGQSGLSRFTVRGVQSGGGFMKISLYTLIVFVYFYINTPICVGERKDIMNTRQLYLFDPSTEVIHGLKPSLSPTQTVGGSLFKKCHACGKTLPAPNFSKNSTRKDGLQTQCKACHGSANKEWSNANKSKHKELKKRWMIENRENCKAYSRERYKTLRDETRKYHRQWYAKNIEKCSKRAKLYREKNLEKEKLRSKKYKSSNRDKTKLWDSRKRARKLRAKGYSYTTTKHIQGRWEMYGGKCWMCGKPAEHTDHVIPLNVGGSHWPSNLRPACARCNCSRPRNGSDLPTRKSR
jgi:hypothetical protein